MLAGADKWLPVVPSWTVIALVVGGLAVALLALYLFVRSDA
jgi:hypothetical protein